MNHLLKLLGETWFGNFLGLVGGVLGIWSFIDLYILKFKPRVVLGNKVVFLAKKQNWQPKNNLSLSSIILSLDIGNHRNKYGYIHDFAVRIFQSNALNPDHAMYFITNILEKLPLTINDLKSNNNIQYTPLNMLPKTSRILNLEYSDLRNRSNMTIDYEQEFALEIYYQKWPNSKWQHIGKYSLYLQNALIDDVGTSHLLYSVLDWNVSRDKIFEKLLSTRSCLYSGLSQKYLLRFFNLWKIKIFVMPFIQLKDVILCIFISIIKSIAWVYDSCIRSIIIRIKGVRLQDINISEANRDKKQETIRAFNEICTITEKMINKINTKADKNAIITVEKEMQSITITRPKLSLKIYVSGNTSIYTADLNTLTPRLSYNLTLKQTSIGYSYWELDGYGPLTIKSFVLRILDAFLLHSCY